MSRDLFVDLGDHALQRLARTTLGEVVGTVGNHILNTLSPTDGTRELGNEVSLDLSRISMRLSIDILIDRTLRRLDLRLLDGSLKLVLGRLHQRRVERATHLQHQCTLSTSGLQLLAGLTT